jgi:RNA-binding protein YhbY
MLQVGKNGLSEDILAELQAQLKRHKMVKIRIGRSAPFSSKEEAFIALRNTLPDNVQIIETRGWTVILERTV